MIFNQMKKLETFLCVDLKTGVQVVGFYRSVFYGVLSAIIFDLFVVPPTELCGRAKQFNRDGSAFTRQHCDLLTTLFTAVFIYAVIYSIVHIVVLIGIFKRNPRLILPAIIVQGIEFLMLVPVHLIIVLILIAEGLALFTFFNLFVFCVDFYMLNAFYSLYQKINMRSKEKTDSISMNKIDNSHEKTIDDI